jgi:proline dehydrogenase
MDTKRIWRLLVLAAAVALIVLTRRHGEVWLRSILLYLSTAVWARALVAEFPFARRVASRFVAGEDIEAVMAATRGLNEQGMMVTLDYLGENVTSIEDALDARDQILMLLDRIQETGANANVSIKLSQLGLNIDPVLAGDNAKSLLERASQYDNKIRIDMEESAVTERTLEIYRALRDEHAFCHRVGIVIQAYLYRSAVDVEKLVDEGAWVRLCKGAYAEPPDIAFPVKADTDANFVKLMQLMLADRARENGVYLGVATHDEKMIQATKQFARDNDIPLRDFEFQMLYGVRRDLQESLVAEGCQMRVYVPYGTAWYPYFVRRLAEHPANLWFFVSNLLRG